VKHVFWLEAGRLAGRAGPNREPWDLGELHAGGIRAVLSVNDGVCCHAEDFAALEIAYACAAMPDSVPPAPGDEQRCREAAEHALSFIDEHLAADRTVLVHCSSGKDRTGLVLAYYLVKRRGYEPEEALAVVRAVRPIALSAEGWEDLALRLLSE
jgi:protein-tyrosine phosphatase